MRLKEREREIEKDRVSVRYLSLCCLLVYVFDFEPRDLCRRSAVTVKAGDTGVLIESCDVVCLSCDVVCLSSGATEASMPRGRCHERGGGTGS